MKFLPLFARTVLHCAACCLLVSPLGATLAAPSSSSVQSKPHQHTSPAPQELIVTYTYENRRPSSISVNGRPIVTDVIYEPFGPVGGWQWGNSTQARPNIHLRLFDRDYRNIAITSDLPDSAGVTVFKRILKWDYAGRIVGLTDPHSTVLSRRFDYDDLDRLTKVLAGSVAGDSAMQLYGYRYDAAGNRIASETSAGATTYGYDTKSHHLLTLRGAQNRDFAYDPAGNMISDGINTWHYSPSGRADEVSNAGGTTKLLVNAMGQRVLKKGPLGTVQFMYDEKGYLQAEYDETGRLIQQTVWLEDLPVATLRLSVAGVSIFYIHPDHLGTPRLITRASDDAIVWRWDDIDPFGHNPPNENPSGLGTFEYNLGFPGMYRDKETGTFYNYFRDNYLPELGRYGQSDPIGLKGGMNTYSYVGGNPFQMVDPLGLTAELCTRNFYPLAAVPYAQHCFLRFDGDDKDTLGFSNAGVEKDGAPTWWPNRSCSPTEGEQDDDCVRREIRLCKASDYDFAKFNCCHCAQRALEACRQWAPKWPNWPINPARANGQPERNPPMPQPPRPR